MNPEDKFRFRSTLDLIGDMVGRVSDDCFLLYVASTDGSNNDMRKLMQTLPKGALIRVEGRRMYTEGVIAIECPFTIKLAKCLFVSHKCGIVFEFEEPKKKLVTVPTELRRSGADWNF